MNKKNIIYLCNAEKGAAGGAKIIYNHSQLINSFKDYSSQVVHIRKKKTAKWKNSFKKKLNMKISSESGWKFDEIEPVKKFKYRWFKNNTSIKDDLNFNSKSDFVILPEIYSHLAEELLIKKNIKYAIFVQNGYAINSTNNNLKLENSYQNAEFILSYSTDITECIKLNFPNLNTRIIKVKVSVQPTLKNLPNKKKKLITFMSRKHPFHSSLVINFLQKYLPKDWKLKDLKDMDEREVYKYLGQSKIFLAFSNLEGLALPPVEASLCGNFVIGYTGEGAKDYWRKPLFTEVFSGDLRNFVKEIMKKVSKDNLNYKKHLNQYNWLRNEFSKKNEIIHIKNFLNLIND